MSTGSFQLATVIDIQRPRGTPAQSNNTPLPIPRTPLGSADSAGAELKLPPEVSLAEAARIANCDKKTVIRYIKDGVLEWRNIAPPSSSRPTYRIKLASLLAMRTAYHFGDPRRDHRRDADLNRAKQRSTADHIETRHQFKHVQINRS